MADAVLIKHAKVSAKADLPDSALILPSDWNAAEILSGGQDGQLCMKDSTKATGAKWSQSIVPTLTNGTYSGTSPSGALGAAIITIADKCVTLGWINAVCTLASGTTYTLNLRRNGTVIVSHTLTANGTTQMFHHTLTELTPTTVTYDFTVSAGANFTSFVLVATFITFPIP